MNIAKKEDIKYMYTIPPFDRPALGNRYQATVTSFLVRSLVNGLYYYPLPQSGMQGTVCATHSPMDIKGFPTYREALRFARRIEGEKKSDICIGRPPYTRIETKTSRIEVTPIDADESSASDIL